MPSQQVPSLMPGGSRAWTSRKGSEEVGVGDAFDAARAVRAPTRRRRRRRRRQPEGLGRLAKVTEVGATRARRLSAQGSV